MSDSVKLQFEHGIWCLVFSYVCLAVSAVSIVLMILVHGAFFILAFFSFIGFIVLIAATIDYLESAIAISKKEGEKKILSNLI